MKYRLIQSGIKYNSCYFLNRSLLKSFFSFFLYFKNRSVFSLGYARITRVKRWQKRGVFEIPVRLIFFFKRVRREIVEK